VNNKREKGIDKIFSIDSKSMHGVVWVESQYQRKKDLL
jgi:hypothetical protein